jgi:hypothetical protein
MGYVASILIAFQSAIDVCNVQESIHEHEAEKRKISMTLVVFGYS